jgi:hypothetical protein
LLHWPRTFSLWEGPPCLSVSKRWGFTSSASAIDWILIEQIWNSLPEQVAPPEVPEWHLAELARRRAQAETQPGLGKPWREVLDRLEGNS